MRADSGRSHRRGAEWIEAQASVLGTRQALLGGPRGAAEGLTAGAKAETHKGRTL
jgi:hypothetical protein